MTKRFLTLKEAADYLGISETELDGIVGKSEVPSYKIGGIYTRFKVDDLDSYRRKTPAGNSQKDYVNISDRIKDFFYFNDFYIFSCIAIIVILYFIFK